LHADCFTDCSLDSEKPIKDRSTSAKAPPKHPIRTVGDACEIVQNMPLNDFGRRKIDASINEMKEEKGLVEELYRIRCTRQTGVVQRGRSC
jgi:hypothetical protein